MGNNKYAGTQTEKNLLEAFSGESQATNILILHPLQRKKDTSRCLHCSLRRQIMKKNMLKCGLKN